MEYEELKRRIDKKTEQINKIKRRVSKWQNGLTNQDIEFAKTATSWTDISRYSSKHPHTNDYERKVDIEELYCAYKDLDTANTQLDKYNNLLKAIEDKRNTKKIDIIVQFLDNWKKSAKKFVLENVNCLIKYLALNSELCELSNHRYEYLQKMTEEEWKQRYNQLREEEKAQASMIHPWTRATYRHLTKTIDTAELDKILEKEKENKYWNLVNIITEKAGEIQDVTNLKIGGKGDLNGVVIGSKNKVHVETILAGGYNQDKIVNVKHGQIFHYRTLCNIIK